MIVLVADITAEHLATSRQDTIRSMLLDTVNHELCTPFTIVLANAELIIDAAPDLPEPLHEPFRPLSVLPAGCATRFSQSATSSTSSQRHMPCARTPKSTNSCSRFADRYRDQARAPNIIVEIDCPSSLARNLDLPS